MSAQIITLQIIVHRTFVAEKVVRTAQGVVHGDDHDDVHVHVRAHAHRVRGGVHDADGGAFDDQDALDSRDGALDKVDNRKYEDSFYHLLLFIHLYKICGTSKM